MTEGLYIGEMIDFVRPDGQPSKGYLVEPNEEGSAPGIVVIHEWWGLNEQIMGEAEKLAVAGFRALVPDLYRGKQPQNTKEAMRLIKELDVRNAVGQDIRGAVQYLKSSGSDKVGVTGFCMGGALALIEAMFVAESNANATWYGYPPLKYVDASKIKAPLLGHFAAQDKFFPIDGVDALADKLIEAGVNFTFHRYNAKNAFANEEADARGLPQLGYDSWATRVAWLRTLAFFDKHLRY